MTSTVAVTLCGPEQTWGDETNIYEKRTTGGWPTKSGITGIFAAAIGLDRDDEENIALLASSHNTIRINSHGLKRTDLQTINGTITTRGKTRKTIMSEREHLQNACFTVFATWDDNATATEVEKALIYPYYPLFLGRRHNHMDISTVINRYPDKLSDTLIASQLHCETHPPRKTHFTIIEDSTAPLNTKDLYFNNTYPINYETREYKHHRVLQRHIPVQAEHHTPEHTYTIDKHGVLITEKETT